MLNIFSCAFWNDIFKNCIFHCTYIQWQLNFCMCCCLFRSHTKLSKLVLIVSRWAWTYCSQKGQCCLLPSYLHLSLLSLIQLFLCSPGIIIFNFNGNVSSSSPLGMRLIFGIWYIIHLSTPILPRIKENWEYMVTWSDVFTVSSEITTSLPLLSFNIFNYNLIAELKPFLPFGIMLVFVVVCHSFHA